MVDKEELVRKVFCAIRTATASQFASWEGCKETVKSVDPAKRRKYALVMALADFLVRIRKIIVENIALIFLNMLFNYQNRWSEICFSIASTILTAITQSFRISNTETIRTTSISTVTTKRTKTTATLTTIKESRPGQYQRYFITKSKYQCYSDLSEIYF